MKTRALMPTLTAIVLVVAVVGSNFAGGPFKTPEEVFEAAKTAAKKGDFKTFVQCLAPENIAEAADGIAMMVAMMAGLAEKLPEEAKAQMKGMFEAAAKHGLTADMIKKLPPLKLDASKEDQEKAMKTLTATIKNKAAFVADFMASMGEKERTAMQEEIASSSLKDLKVDGDKATAKIASKSGGKDREQPVQFRRIDGSWRMVMDMKK